MNDEIEFENRKVENTVLWPVHMGL